MVNHVEGKEPAPRSSRDEQIQAFATELATRLGNTICGLGNIIDVFDFREIVLRAVKLTPFPKLETEIHNHFYPTKDHVVYAVGEVVRIEPAPLYTIKEGVLSPEEAETLKKRGPTYDPWHMGK
jgi:hypothetical protein